MLDITFIRNNPRIVEKDLRKRGKDYRLITEFLEKDKEWRELKGQTDELRRKRNELTIEITKLSKEKKDIIGLVAEARELPGKIKQNEERLEVLRKETSNILNSIPNILHESVPIGKDDTENKIVKVVGKKLKFKFSLQSHVDLIEKNNWVDLERAAKISGARWYFLKGDLALLEMAITKYAIDFMIKRKFIFVIPPHMMNWKSYEGVTDLGTFEEMLYKIEGEDLYQIATSEHPITAMYMNEVIGANKLPMKFVGYSTNFRKEAGAHGKDQKGIFRVHQFNKVEQVVLCMPKQSWKIHEELIKNAADFFKSLGLHYRIVNVCTGDMGVVASKKYDIEVWCPVQNAFREVVSCSNCTEYQAVGLNMKYSDNEKRGYLHTLNSTCVATSRALVAILENYQQKYGSIKIPKVLIKYMAGKKIIGGYDGRKIIRKKSNRQR